MSAPERPTLLGVLRRHYPTLLRNALIVSVVVAGASFLIPNQFTARSVLLPPSEDAELGGLSSGIASSLALSRAFGFDLQTKTNLYLGVLLSDGVNRRLVERFGLMKVYKRKDAEKAGRELHAHTAIRLTNEGFVEIAVRDRSPQRAAELANAYVDELESFLRENAVHNARQRREYMDGRLGETRASLTAAENALRDYQVRHHMPAIGVSDAAAADAVGELVAQRLSREVELGTLRSVTRGVSPRAEQLQSEIHQLDSEIAKLPPAATDAARLYREVKVQEKLLLVLTEERERARLLELKNMTSVERVDSAIPPLHKSDPKRLWIALGAFLAALFAGIAWVWVKDGAIPPA